MDYNPNIFEYSSNDFQFSFWQQKIEIMCILPRSYRWKYFKVMIMIMAKIKRLKFTTFILLLKSKIPSNYRLIFILTIMPQIKVVP